MSYLNIGSLLLGLIAWILPIVTITKLNNTKHINRIAFIAFSIASVSACSISLFFQIAYQNYLVSIEDWTALMDTSGTLVFVSAVLLIVTLTLNIAAFINYCKIVGFGIRS